MRLIWEDHFDGPALNASLWNVLEQVRARTKGPHVARARTKGPHVARARTKGPHVARAVYVG